jgi:hypothetical protein
MVIDPDPEIVKLPPLPEPTLPSFLKRRTKVASPEDDTWTSDIPDDVVCGHYYLSLYFLCYIRCI